MFEALLNAWGGVLDPTNLSFLVLGVLMGLTLGAIPGVGGLIGLTILIPFVYEMSPGVAIATLIGMTAVTATSDSIPAILFGIPGTVAAQATILDGYPMSRKGEAARALGASFSASALGGLFGAIVLFASIPILRPLVLQFRSPEFFMLAMLGISMVAVLSRGAVAKGLAAGGVGLLLTTIGQDPISGVFRYVYDTDYLWEGLPIASVALGLFAIPELVDLVIGGGTISRKTSGDLGTGRWQGVRDTAKNWLGVLRSSCVGVFVGVIPGMGGTVVDWFAYGVAKQTSRKSETFGSGDVRGVIAVDAASNAKEGGALVTTVAFGVPGSVSMALMLVAFQIQGLIPGPLMLTKQVVFTLTMVWSLVVANLIGATICFLFVAQIARIARIRVHRLFPVLMVLIFVGAFQSRASFGDLTIMLIVGAVAWSMKRAGWPRPPLILGYILGVMIQESLFLSIHRYGAEWILDPIPLGLGVMCLASIAYGIFYQPGVGRVHAAPWRAKPNFTPRIAVTLFFMAVAVFFVFEAQDWVFEAWLFPTAMGVPLIVVLTYQGARDIFTEPNAEADQAVSDLAVDRGQAGRMVLRQGGGTFLWLLGLLGGISLFGLPVTVVVFLALYLRFRADEKWWFAGSVAVGALTVLFFFFDQVLHVVWPEGYLLPGPWSWIF